MRSLYQEDNNYHQNNCILSLQMASKKSKTIEMMKEL